jgi:hypothetical protein
VVERAIRPSRTRTVGHEATDQSDLDWLDRIDPQIVACLSPLEQLLISVLREYKKEKGAMVASNAIAESMDSKIEE